MIWICLIHIWTPFRIYHGSIGVDFFFISSGFFLYRGFQLKQISVYQFTRRRFLRLFPTYIIGVLLGYLILFADSLKDGSSISSTTSIEGFITEILLLQDAGWFTNLMLGNPVSWYVSVLFIAGILLYAALNYDQRLTIHILLPLFCIGFYTIIAHNGIHENGLLGTAIGPLFPPLGRGLAGLSLGILIGKIAPELEMCSRLEKTVLNTLSILFLGLITVYILFIEETHYTLAIVFFVFIIASCVIPDSWFNRLFNHRIWFFLGDITYEMLMMQIPCRYLINFGYNLFPAYRILWILAYLLLTILSACLLKRFLNRIIPKLTH